MGHRQAGGGNAADGPFLGKVLAEAGLPNGVYNALSGTGEETAAALVSHPDVSPVTFTGSVETGKLVMKGAADHVASVTLELGGKSPIVVLADADLDSALAGIMKAIFTHAGQLCSAGSRLIVERPVANVLLRLTVATQALTAGAVSTILILAR
jgi:acyl-CoA reductase-like NAD-dependent aldehyde dehydrogenase